MLAIAKARAKKNVEAATFRVYEEEFDDAVAELQYSIKGKDILSLKRYVATADLLFNFFVTSDLCYFFVVVVVVMFFFVYACCCFFLHLYTFSAFFSFYSIFLFFDTFAIYHN